MKTSLMYLEKTKITVIMLIFVCFGLLLVFTGSSYAYITANVKQSDQNVVQTGTLQISYDDTASGLGGVINLANAYPVTDAVGKTYTPYKFKITNTGTLPVDYKFQILNDTVAITADACASKLLSFANLRYSINAAAPLTLGDLAASNYTMASGKLAPGASITYSVQMWIKDTSGNDILGKHYHGKVVITGA